MKGDLRSNCPVSCALDILGDKWTLIIVRDMLLFGKETFKDFSESSEGIATNILSSRLKSLEEFGIATKHKSPTNKKVNIYKPTEKGISLLPVVVEMVLWSHSNLREKYPELAVVGIEPFINNKEASILQIQKNLRDALQQQAF